MGKVMFLGCDDAGYVYTYVGASAGVGVENQGAVGLSGSVNVFLDLFDQYVGWCINFL